MKLFLATNFFTTKINNIKLLEKSVKSAIKNTNFDIYVLFDGKKEELNLPAQVNVIEHRHRCYDIFESNKNTLCLSSAAFLRTEIPFLCKKLNFQDDFVLYTDYDVLFQKSNYSDLNFLKPDYFAACPEFDKKEWSYINSGVMLMNINNLFSMDGFILNYIKENFNNFEVFDQSLYNDLYKNRITRLPIEYNWKVYWGINQFAKIIHFHGAKPLSSEPPGRADLPMIKELREKDLDSYNYYNKIWEET
jgi:lipopolysaccharide biosynthesis glycosyltransferase